MPARDHFVEELANAVKAKSVRSLAKASGWGRSTVHEWLKGVRRPNPDQLDDLLDACDVAPRVRQRLHELRLIEPPSEPASTAAPSAEPGVPNDETSQAASLGSGQEPDASVAQRPGFERPPVTDPNEAAWASQPSIPAGYASDSGVSRDRQRRTTVAAVWGGVAAVTAIAVIFGAGFVVGRSQQPRVLVGAAVVNAEGEGAPVRHGASEDSPQVGTLRLGETVYVACLDPDGEPIVDQLRGGFWPVWARLSDGTWVSDLKLDTDKSWAPDSGPPPHPHRRC